MRVSRKNTSKIYHRVRRALIPYVLLSQSLFILSFMLLASLILAVYSFMKWSPEKLTQQIFTLDNYARFLSDPFYVSSLLLTLKLGILVTLGDLAIGYPIAFSIARVRNQGLRRVVNLIVLTPLLMSALVQAYGWLVLLSPSGLVNMILIRFGLVHKPIELIFNENGLVISLVHAWLPYMVLPLVSVIGRIDRSLEEAAQSLGAGRFKTFYRITFPLSAPGILAGCIFTFTLTASAFMYPILIGGTKVQVMSMHIRDQMGILLNWPFGSAIAMILLIIVFVFTAAYGRVLERK